MSSASVTQRVSRSMVGVSDMSGVEWLARVRTKSLDHTLFRGSVFIPIRRNRVVLIIHPGLQQIFNQFLGLFAGHFQIAFAICGDD
jgi:hypothetical protein